MYIDVDKRLRCNLMDMSIEECCALARMIRGAGLEERRMFHGILREIEKPLDELTRKHHDGEA